MKNSRELRAATLLILVGVLRFVWAPTDERGTFALEMDAGAQEPQTMQLYFQRHPDSGFSEVSSVAVELRSAEMKRYRFRLPDGVYRALRFDPMKGAGVARFAAARIVSLRTGGEHCPLPVSTWTIGQNVQRATITDGTLEVEVASDQLDPTLNIPLPKVPLTLQRGTTGRVAMTLVALLLASLVVFGWPRTCGIARIARLKRGLILRPLTAIENWVQRIFPREFLLLDRFAIGFLLVVTAAALTAAALGLHGSSSTLRSRTGVPHGEWEPLFGTPKNIRWDEWNLHTPLILYQANRADPFAVEPSLIGPHKTTLIGNVPVRHWTIAFRPQYWSFFFLPTRTAFAAYWQAKTVLLLSGTFLLFLLLSRCSKLAAFGAVWFYLSSFTQWAFSWPAMLPEMIGLASLSVVAACLMFVVTSHRVAGVLGIVFVLTSVNFVLCAYPPFQVPLVWAAIGLTIAWLAEHARVSHRSAANPFRWSQGLVAAGSAGLAAVFVTLLFLQEIRPVVETTAQTIYPGNRSLPGGGMSWQQLVSAFVDPLKAEAKLPPQFMNICEGTGYFWLCVLSLPCAAPMLRCWRAPRAGRRLYFFLLLPWLLLATWAVVDIPASFGRMFLLDKVQSTRVLPALGLINVAVTLVFLRLVADFRVASPPMHARFRNVLLLVVATSISFLLLHAMNRGIDEFFRVTHLAGVAVLMGTVTVALARGSTSLVAILVLVPLTWTNLLVNPVDRGLAIYDESALRGFVDTHGGREDGWLVMDENATTSVYFSALGLDVFNVLHFVPKLDTWRKFDPRGELTAFYNGSGTTIARALPTGSEASIGVFEGAALGPPIFRRLSVDPADPRLREIGIRYFAVPSHANSAPFPEEHFERLTEIPVDGFLVFRRRDP